MTNEAAADRIKRELADVLDNLRNDLDRVELLAAALTIFSRPVLDYEPRFHHVPRAHELGQTDTRKPPEH
jgi:hypothetical protein